MQDRSIEYHPFKLVTSFTFLLFGQSETLWFVAAAFFLTLALSVVFIMDLWKARKVGSLSHLTLPGLMVICVVGLPVASFYARPFFLPERTMAAASPFLLILTIWGVAQRKSPLPYLVGLAAAIMLVGSALYLFGEPIKPPYRDAIQFVERHLEDRDVVLHTSDGSYVPSLTYVDLPRHALLSGDPDLRKPPGVYEALGGEIWTVKQAAENGERLWLIVALEHSIEWQQEQVELFGRRYNELESHEFGGIIVMLYELSPA
jgi:hypothetical protein